MSEKQSKPRNNEKIYRKEIIATENSIDKEKKKYRSAVKALLKADKNLKSIEKKAKKKQSEKNIKKLEDAKKAVAMAALDFKACDDVLDVAIEDLQHKSNYLCRYYHSNGKVKKAKKESARFDKYYERFTAELNKVTKDSDNVISSAFADMVVFKNKKKKKNQEPEEAVAPVAIDPAEEPALIAPEAEVTETAGVAYAPVAEAPAINASFAEALEAPAAYAAPQGNVSVAPLSLDVTEIVEEAVNATMKSFMAALEKKMAGAGFTAPVVNAAEASNPEALSTVAAEEAYVVNKLSELIEGMKEIMEAINSLSAKSAELVEKQKAASEVQNELTKTQRTTMREIQGIQVRQKLVISEQEALVSEQTVAFEHHKLVAEAQQALSEQQQISVEEINALIDNQKALNATVKETVDSNKSIVALAEKTVEIQKNLSEKQQNLLTVQKEAMAAHRQMARGQRTAEAKRRTAEKKAQAPAEAPAVEAEVSLEAMATE